MNIKNPLSKALAFGLLALLSLTLFLNGFEEGINLYLGSISWYIKVLIGVVIAWFVGKKLI